MNRYEGPAIQLWEAMCNADYLARYYGELGARYEAFETRGTFAVLALSSATVVSFLDKFHASWPETASWLGLWLAVLTAAASLWLALRRYGKAASLAAYLGSKFSQSQQDYERTWSRIDSLDADAVIDRIAEVQARETEWEHIARREIPCLRKLRDQAFDEMISVRFPDLASGATA